jgi:hypothetical protein
METRDDLRQFASKEDMRMIAREELRGVRSDVKAIRSELDELRDKVDNIAGYRKEIDHALERIAAIRKHLGLNKKIAGEAGTTRQHLLHQG